MKFYLYPLLFLIACLLVACSGESEEEKAIREQKEIQETLTQANELLYSNQAAGAVEVLEPAVQAFPQDPGLAEALGFAYSVTGESAKAAAAFQQSAQADPNRSQNFLYAAKEFVKAGNLSQAATAYALYLQDAPNDALARKEYAQVLNRLNKPREALDEYHKAIKRAPTQPTAEQKVAVAQLYQKLGNLPQAEIWFNDALDDPNAEAVRLEVLVSMLEIEYARKNWNQAEQLIAKIDQESPGFLEISDMAFAREELAKWRKAQEDLKKARQLSASTTESEPTEITTEKPTRGSKEDLSEPDPVIETTEPEVEVATVEPTQEAEPTPEPEPQTENEPATVAPTPLAGQAEVEPAPLVGQVVTEGNTSSLTEVVPAVGEPATEADGDAAAAQGRYKLAIDQYRDALVRNYQNPQLWEKLSRAYFADQQYSNAEMAALQAVELNPSKVEYTLLYLQAVQKSQSASVLMRELKRAAQRLPESPEVAFALATGFERIENNDRNAIFYYRRFLALAPDGHPRRQTAQEAIGRLAR